MFCKSSKKKGVGNILLGFFILMTGMEFMSSSMKPLADMPWVQQPVPAFFKPHSGRAGRRRLTAIIQSSSASVGILVGLWR